MTNSPKMTKNPNKDVVLCKTTNRIVSLRTTKLLLESSVPFSTIWKHVPLFLRPSYNWASKVCIISISRTQYPKARRVLTSLERRDYDRLMLNVI